MQKHTVLILLALAGRTTIGVGQPMADFVIRLPHEVNPEMVMIATGIYGVAGMLPHGGVRTKKGVYDYPVVVEYLGGDRHMVLESVQHADSLKLLIYCPGYKMVTATFSKEQLRTRHTFAPPLERLPTTPLQGRLVNSKQQPLAGQTLSLSYDLSEAMGYIGYIEGTVPSLRIAAVKTNGKGMVTLEVPAFADDPFFQAYRGGHLEISSKTDWSDDDTLRPDTFSRQNNYPHSLLITKTLHGTLSGELGKAFHGLTGDLTRYIDSGSVDLEADDGQSSYNANLKNDRTFAVELPPGKYDLILRVYGPGFTVKDSTTIRSGIVVQESKRTVITRIPPTPH